MCFPKFAASRKNFFVNNFEVSDGKLDRESDAVEFDSTSRLKSISRLISGGFVVVD
jgi:hypothetical protein